MALRAIRLNRDPVLYRKCREVEQVDNKVRQLLDDMLQTLHATSNGAAVCSSWSITKSSTSRADRCALRAV